MDVAVDLFKVISKHRHTGYITASSVTDLFYIIHKNLHNNEKTYQSMDYIVTVNIKDYEKEGSDFVITPEECIELLKQ